ncbi:hypothetical protein [Pseudonocardia phyllosphaerae]|uniref:hypothetical protein n=1 Tax=Pseudonocardia phyllosphaerae TaxID=3390502 RepID=UPI00397C4E8A
MSAREAGRQVARRAPAPRLPWGTAGCVAAAAAATWTARTTHDAWWTGVAVPRAPEPEDLLRSGAAVPMPAGADAFTHVSMHGTTVWADLDGDGWADRADLVGAAPDPGADDAGHPDLPEYGGPGPGDLGPAW